MFPPAQALTLFYCCLKSQRSSRLNSVKHKMCMNFYQTLFGSIYILHKAKMKVKSSTAIWTGNPALHVCVWGWYVQMIVLYCKVIALAANKEHIQQMKDTAKQEKNEKLRWWKQQEVTDKRKNKAREIGSESCVNWGVKMPDYLTPNMFLSLSPSM